MKKCSIVLWFFCVMFFLDANAQQQKLNADSVFIAARTYAQNKDYEKAREKCFELLSIYPDYYDARVLVGRTFAWQHEYDSARIEINKVLDKSNYIDAIYAIIDIENWSGDLPKAIYYCDYGQKHYPANENFMILKARMLLQTKDTNLAQREILHALELSPGNLEAIDLLKEIKKVNILNKVAIQYSYEYYKDPWVRKWNLMNVDYSRQTKLGSVTARMYLGDVVFEGESLFEKNTSKQFELEAYPVISRKNYSYVSYGYSPDNLFPRHRAGAEIYQKLFNTFELSGGIRYLQFKSTEGTINNVFIYTGSVGKYIHNYWFSFRPYLNSKTNGLSQSYYLTARRYLSTKDNFVSLELGSGNSPDDPLNYGVNFETFKLNMKKIQLSWHQLIADRWIVYLIGAYQNEEYTANLNRDKFSFKLQLGYHF